MDFYRAIQFLHGELGKVNQAISTLEALASGKAEAPSRRGRKSMSADERKAVSERMRRYWEARRSAARSARAS